MSQTLTYNDANQVDGWTYDAAGNLTNDGTTTYQYDALNRLTVQDSTTNVYNGDGVLVQQGATPYTQDLAAPLSQILADGTYRYGRERLFAETGGTRTWYVGDALGSVRQLQDDNGIVLGSQSYDPWGVPDGTPLAPFGFTGELQQQGGLTYLRARWYAAGSGVFTGRDAFEGYDERPYSLHSYQYAYANPALLTDPSERLVYYLDSVGEVRPASGGLYAAEIVIGGAKCCNHDMTLRYQK